MGKKSKIEWTDATWNPVTGCSKISEGCLNCYAKRDSKRLAGRYGYPADDPFRVTFHGDKLHQPIRWTKSRRIFVCSMGDLFHEDVKPRAIRLILDMAYQAGIQHGHKFLFLTKRPEAMKYFIEEWLVGGICGAGAFCYEQHGGHSPPDFFWLGVTAENQKRADERIPILLQIPAACGLSVWNPCLDRWI